jgi:hypothetical protein
MPAICSYYITETTEKVARIMSLNVRSNSDRHLKINI